MRNRQLGVSLTGLIIGAVILIFVLLLGMKTLPPYLEFFTAKKLITQIANEQRSGSVNDIKKAWQLKTAVENVESINERDLEITKEGGEAVVTANWSVRVPLVSNVSACLDFSATTAK